MSVTRKCDLCGSIKKVKQDCWVPSLHIKQENTYSELIEFTTFLKAKKGDMCERCETKIVEALKPVIKTKF